MRGDTLTLLPALFLFLVSSYLAFSTFQVVDFTVKRGLLVFSLSLFVGGLVLTFCWFYYWGMHKGLQERGSAVISQRRSLWSLVGFFLIAFGSITLVWVGHLTWHDITVWGKDIPLIFFGSRTGENISLGIGMKVIHYFLIGLALLLPGFAVFLRRRLRKCPHHFGYLANHPKKESIPKKCFICPYARACADQPQKQKPLDKPTAKKEKDTSKCSHHFGYLRSLPNNQAVPQECTTCQKLVECRNPI